MRGIANETKRRTLFDFYRLRSDILCIQETHCTRELQDIWRNEWGGNVFYSNGTSNSKGVAVLINRGFYCDYINHHTDSKGRMICVNLKIDGECVSVINVYAPNKDNVKFVSEMEELYLNANGHKVVVGDFNVALNCEMDRHGTQTNNNKMGKALEAFLDQNYLVDIWRLRNPDEKQFTWMKITQGNLKASRIDYIFVSRGIDQLVKNVMFLPGIMTDHRACQATIEIVKSDRGAGYWKFNNSLLEDEEICQQIENEICKTIESNSHKNSIQRWEQIKNRAAKCVKNCARKKSNEEKELIGNLTEVVNDMESRQPLNSKDQELLNSTKQDLEQKLLERTKGLIFRSRANWYEMGEKCNKYFLGLERARYNAKTCFSMIDEETQQCVEENSKILKMQQKFYSKLYQETGATFNLVNDTGIFVDQAEKDIQNADISLQELKDALFILASNKTPGYDGLTTEFYKKFWHLLDVPLLDALELCYSNKEMFPSAQKGVLNLIPKPGKDSRLLKNLRPITLLNVD